jgi:hypothetical protein
MSTRVVISVSGGVVTAVCTDNKDLEVYLVDFENLEADPNQDCSVGYTVDSLDDFRTAVRGDVEQYPGISKLLSRLAA